MSLDSMIPISQKSTLTKYMILSGANNRPPMLDKALYDSWKSIMELYMQNREHGRMILELVEHGPLIQADCDLKATNIILQGLSTDVYALVNLLLMQVNQQPHAEFSQTDSGLAIPVFNQGDDPIDAMNKIMSFLSTVVSSRFPSTNNQLRTSSNSRQQATIQDGRVTVQQVVKCFNCQGEGHMARQCSQPKRKRDATWFRDKVLLVEAQGSGKVLNREELDFLADL
ncbi:retrovirus-related pol polyprotein from transposon TNT 1-94 [Tanacetum coccineum]